MFDPKWFVIGFALGAFALILNYDLTLGIAAGVILGVFGLFYLWVKLRFAPEPGEPLSERDALVKRFQRLGRNRRVAQIKESSAKTGTDPRKSA